MQPFLLSQGSDVLASSGEKRRMKMYCKACGSDIRGRNFCTSCGQSSQPTAKKKTKIVIPILAAMILLAAGMLYFFVLHDNQPDLNARIMSVFRVEGDSVNLQQSDGARANAREGTGLHAGNIVSTGLDSFCYIRLDAASIVKMDQSTDVYIAQLSDRLLRINIDRGQVMVDLQWQEHDHELEAIIGNTVISVRGTQFIAGVYAGGEAIVSVLGGSIYVNDVVLEAGYTMRVFDGIEMIYEVESIDFYNADEFLLAAAGVTAIDDEEVIYIAEQDDTTEDEQDDTAVFEVMTAYVGELIEFGPYMWRVLDVQGSQALLLTDGLVGGGWYHDALVDVTWEISAIRRWLNGEFLDRFSQQDQARIAVTYVVNLDNQWFGGNGGNNTYDRVFLLSIEEVVRYFGDSGQLSNRPEGAGAWIDDQYNYARMVASPDGRLAENFVERGYQVSSQWWLRSPGYSNIGAATVDNEGTLRLGGIMVFFDGLPRGFRPALWIELGR